VSQRLEPTSTTVFKLNNASSHILSRIEFHTLLLDAFRTSEMAYTEHYDVVIIGAGMCPDREYTCIQLTPETSLGWYGLITASTYLKLAPGAKLLIVDDGASIGGVWSKERIYPNLFAQVGHGLFEFSSYPMKKEGLTSDRYISGNTIHSYLNDFARAEDLVRRTRLNTRIIKVDKDDHGNWHLSLKDSTSLTTSKLVVATGVSSGPYVPNIPQSETFKTPVIHSSQIGQKLDDLQTPATRCVTVLGAAKSSYDTVFLLLKAGKQVDWIIREDGSGPLAIMPPRLAGLMNTVDIMATRALASASPAVLNARGIWYNLLHKTRIGRVFVKTFWRNLTRLAEYQAGYHKSENAEKLRPIPKGYGFVFHAYHSLNSLSLTRPS
jgi:dimethylaniline monooxygenase (N-oxide forming)